MKLINTKTIIKALPSFLFGLALAFIISWFLSTPSYSAKDAAKLQLELMKELEAMEKQTRAMLHNRIDSFNGLIDQRQERIDSALIERSKIEQQQLKSLNNIQYNQIKINEKFNSIDFNRISELDAILGRVGIKQD